MCPQSRRGEYFDNIQAESLLQRFEKKEVAQREGPFSRDLVEA